MKAAEEIIIFSGPAVPARSAYSRGSAVTSFGVMNCQTGKITPGIHRSRQYIGYRMSFSDFTEYPYAKLSMLCQFL